jgi:hypothetical protein
VLHELVVLSRTFYRSEVGGGGRCVTSMASSEWSLMLIIIVGHICLILISPLGELTSMICFMFAIGRLCFETKLDDMNE